MIRALCVVLALAGCRTLPRARRGQAEAPSARELEAARHASARTCSLGWRWLYPGLGHFCLGKRDEGGALVATATAEIGTAILVGRREELSHPGVGLPLLALQDLYVISIVEPMRVLDLAARKRYVPQDTLAELALAPFDPAVLGKPMVLGGILLTAAAAALAVGASDRKDGDPNLFGHRFDPSLGHPLAGLTFAGLFTHVGIAEETLFRGYAQSGFARTWGETWGWVAGSLVFGAAHVPNVLALETEDERRDYLTYAIPVITGVGAYIGAAYWRYDYSLAPPVALHFWYDLIVSTAGYLVDPENSLLSAKVAVPF